MTIRSSPSRGSPAGPRRRCASTSRPRSIDRDRAPVERGEPCSARYSAVVAAAEQEVQVVAHGIPLEGTLAVPEPASGVVVFAHGSGSSRTSPRNRYVAGALQRAGFGTLLVDLLTSREEETDRRTAHLRFNTDSLSNGCSASSTGCWWIRARAVCRSARSAPAPALPPRSSPRRASRIGSALSWRAAAGRIGRHRAGQGARPDPPRGRWRGRRGPGPQPRCAGALDTSSESRLEIVAGAGDLFEETGTLERAAELAAAWFERHLRAAEPPPAAETDGEP